MSVGATARAESVQWPAREPRQAATEIAIKRYLAARDDSVGDGLRLPRFATEYPMMSRGDAAIAAGLLHLLGTQIRQDLTQQRLTAAFE
jgi:hypothetical protein